MGLVSDSHLGQGKAYVTRPYFAVLGGLHDIKKFNVADRSEWLDIKKNDTNYANKRKAGVEGYKAMKKKQKQRND